MPVPMEEIVEELGAALDARFVFLVIVLVKAQSTLDEKTHYFNGS